MDDIQLNVPKLVLWGIEIPEDTLEKYDIEYLKNISSMSRPSVEWIWREMDRVWDELKLDNKKPLQEQCICEYYTHPIWLVNGVFSSADPDSVRHRDSIAIFISEFNLKTIADYGGGFGELARKIRNFSENTKVDIIEPYSSKLGIDRVSDVSGVRFLKEFDAEYDCIVAQDVLEHVEEPLHLAKEMVNAAKQGGYLILANCFYPVIKCHLPGTFYMRHTFPFIVKGMGLKFVCRIKGAEHALVFQKVGEINQVQIYWRNVLAKLLGPFVNVGRQALNLIYRMLFK